MYNNFSQDLKHLWSYTKGVPEVCVAIIDTGVDLAHPAFANGNLKQTSIYGDDTVVYLPSDHGTHVTSIIVGQHESEVKGIAPNIRVVIIPIFGITADNKRVAATQLNLARAINKAIEQGANIINISAGELDETGEPESMLGVALQQCEDNNILVVAAAGNNGCQCLHVPAASPIALSVGAIDENGIPLEQSNWGAAYQVNGLMAPGKDINGALREGTYGLKTGTSFAAPYVSGIAALLLSLQVQLKISPDPKQIRAILLETATPCAVPSEVSCERFLLGTLNIKKALSKITADKQLELSNIKGYTLTPSSDQSIPSASSFIYQKKSFIMENVQDNLSSLGNNSNLQIPSTHLELSESPELNALDQNSTNSFDMPSEVITVTPSETSPSVTLSELDPSCGGEGKKAAGGGCGCNKGGAAPKFQKVYALGTVGYDFANESRRDSFLQHINDNLNDPRIVIDHLEEGHLSEASELIWTLEQEGTPIYAIQPHGPFAREAYQIIVDFMKGQLDEAEQVERVAISGVIAGHVTLLNGQVVPRIVPTIRGMASWSTGALISALGTGNEASGEVYNFLERIYYEYRNFGVTPQERAINFAATNAFQANSVFQNAVSAGQQLSEIKVTKSPIVRPGVEGYDVQLIFFDPQNRFEQARKVYRYTVDVSDVVPVTIGSVRAWHIH